MRQHLIRRRLGTCPAIVNPAFGSLSPASRARLPSRERRPEVETLPNRRPAAKCGGHQRDCNQRSALPSTGCVWPRTSSSARPVRPSADDAAVEAEKAPVFWISSIGYFSIGGSSALLPADKPTPPARAMQSPIRTLISANRRRAFSGHALPGRSPPVAANLGDSCPLDCRFSMLPIPKFISRLISMIPALSALGWQLPTSSTGY